MNFRGKGEQHNKMKRLNSDETYKQVSEENLKYLIEERKLKILPTQNVHTAKFLEAMDLWESGESDLDPRKIVYGWKENKGYNTKEALTAQESGHWLVIARPHIGGLFVTDQDDPAYKKALKQGQRIEKQEPMPKEVFEEKAGIGTYYGRYPTPHGYHHISSKADDPELAGNGAWRIGEYSGDIRCDRGYVVLYDGNALADILRNAPKDAPLTKVEGLVGKKKEQELPVNAIDASGMTEDELKGNHPPSPSLEELASVLNLSNKTMEGYSGACPKCNEGDTRFHIAVKNNKPLFYCFKTGHGEESCDGVNNPETIAKFFESVNNRGDGAAAIARAHRIARKALPDDVSGAELAEALSKFDDLTKYQRELIEWKFWHEWHPDAVMIAEINREKQEMNAKHKELLNKTRETKNKKAEEAEERKAALAAARREINEVEQIDSPFEKGDINAFPWCLKQMGRKFRYNVIKMQIEYLDGGNSDWRITDDHEIDELFIDIAQRFLWADNLKPITFNRGDQMTVYKGNVYRVKYNPWEDYVMNLPQWDGVPRIHQSMDMGGMTIEESPVSAWAQGVAWVDMVRNGIYPGSPRFPEAILFGSGGKGKSSFLSRMLPRWMVKKYFLEGGPSLDSDDKIQIEKGAYLLTEGKEFGGGGKRDWEKVKEMWDKRIYTARLAYGRTTSSHRRCDTRVHTTNRRQIPEDDSAVSRRLIAVKVNGRVKVDSNRRGAEPWDWFDSHVDASDHSRGTYRDQMFAEAKAIIQHHGGAILEDGRYTCNFNYLAYMNPGIAYDPDALLKINQDAGVAYSTEEGSSKSSCLEAYQWYVNAGKTNHTLDLGRSAGGVYNDKGKLIAVKPRGLYSMMYNLQSGHDLVTSAKNAEALLNQDSSTTFEANAVDKESGLTLALKRKFKSVATGGDEPLFKEDSYTKEEPFDGSGKQFRWLRPI